MNFHWTEDADAKLRNFAEEGLSARQIGERIGVGRNAVIGRSHRTGISLKASHGNPKGRKPRDPDDVIDLEARRKERERAAVEKAKREAAAAERAERARKAEAARKAREEKKRLAKVAAVPDVSATVITLGEAAKGHCRWIKGGTKGMDTEICGKPVFISGRPYCAHHMRMAYAPTPAIEKLLQGA